MLKKGDMIMMQATPSSRSLMLVPMLLIGLAGCRTFSPAPMEQVAFTERAQSASRNGITVTAAVLSKDEAQAVFDVKLYKKNIQPIWIEIMRGSTMRSDCGCR